MKTPFLAALLTTLFLLVVPAQLRADINGFSIFKVANYQQTSAAQPTALTEPNAYYFGAQLGSDTNQNYGTNGVMLTDAYFYTPDGFQYFMSTSDQMYFFYSSPYSTNQASFDAAFVPGDYEFQVSDGADTGDVFVPTNSLYSADIPYFTGNTWPAMQAVNPYQPFNLTWNNFTPDPGANAAFIFVRVFDSTGYSPYNTNFISPGVLGAQIPPFVLNPDTTYTIQLFFSDRTNQVNSGFAGDLTGVVGFDNLTTTTLVTQPQASPLLSISLAGTNVILRWPTNAATFNLQGAAQTPPTTGWFYISNTPGIEGNQFILTNAITTPIECFRLQQFGE